MKPMSLLLCGIVVSSISAPALAQQKPPESNWRPGQPPTVEAWQQRESKAREFTPPAPRGDLRGDIASNVRAHPDPPHDDPQRRR